MKILCIVGARPNFVKMAPLLAAMEPYPELEPVLVHTGQHYDRRMSDQFFQDLGIREPDHNLGVGSGSHAAQTAQVMAALEPLCLELEPDLVLVVGDVNSTLAAALVASKLRIPVAHVEAGLRSFDRAMPEEINRLVTDAVSDYLFVTEPSGLENLGREGVAPEKVFFVGNVMVDSLLQHRERARVLRMPARLGLEPGRYAVVTLHRPSNVDDPEALAGLLGVFEAIEGELPIIFPVHPRTRARLADSGLSDRVAAMENLRLTEPVGYLEFLGLLAEARLVLTDSGGIQEETTVLGVPCLTLRENTERPVTVTAGTNQIVGSEPGRIIEAARAALAAPADAQPARPELWDGHAAERIVQVLLELRERRVGREAELPVGAR